LKELKFFGFLVNFTSPRQNHRNLIGMPSSNQCPQTSSRATALLAILLALSSGGCSIWQQPATITAQPVTAIAAPSPPQALTREAAGALDQAQQRVAQAKASRTLWKSALEKLMVAQQAAVKQDSPLVMKLANEVLALCQLSSAQVSQPAVAW
jgi:hypothetical protein